MTNPLVLLSTGSEAEGSDIPSAVPVDYVTPETHGAAGGAPEMMEVVVGVDANSTPCVKHTASRTS
jgi:hypothetical protein